MLIHVKLGVPAEFSEVDLDEVARVFPYGKLLPIEVVTGGLTFGCGRVVPELGDVSSMWTPDRTPRRVTSQATR